MLNLLHWHETSGAGTPGPLRRHFGVLGIRLVVAAIFLYASTDKILHPAAFAKMVYNYRMLPGGLINATAIVLPWLELFLGILLLIGVWQPGAALTANALLVSYEGRPVSPHGSLSLLAYLLRKDAGFGLPLRINHDSSVKGRCVCAVCYGFLWS